MFLTYYQDIYTIIDKKAPRKFRHKDKTSPSLLMKIRQLLVLELSTGLIRVAENFTGRMSRKSDLKLTRPLEKLNPP